MLGVVAGAIQGYFAGKTDLLMQRAIEIWGSMPELYLLIIFSAIFAPSVALLANFFQVTRQHRNSLLNQTAVYFQLRLARTAGADAAVLA